MDPKCGYDRCCEVQQHMKGLVSTQTKSKSDATKVETNSEAANLGKCLPVRQPATYVNAVEKRVDVFFQGIERQGPGECRGTSFRIRWSQGNMEAKECTCTFTHFGDSRLLSSAQVEQAH